MWLGLIPCRSVGPLHEPSFPLGVEDFGQDFGWIHTDVPVVGRQGYLCRIGEDDLFIGVPGVESNVSLSKRHLVHRTRGDDILPAHEPWQRNRLKRRTSKVLVRAAGGGDYTNGANFTRVDRGGEE